MSRSATDRGYLLVDRHVEKNAGSTYRELLFQAESRGLFEIDILIELMRVAPGVDLRQYAVAIVLAFLLADSFDLQQILL